MWTPLDSGTTVLGCDVCRPRSPGDGMTDHLRVEALREHDLGPTPPELEGPKHPSEIGPRTHVHVRRLDPSLSDRVEEPAAVTKGCDADVESLRLQARGEDGKLSFGAADRERGEEYEDANYASASRTRQPDSAPGG